ncbi:MAG: leucine-rich repeat domain-containing protein [Bacteroides sp.]|nr:leucine-rich repeat domain-containing protein [Bacteroides sp.]
MKQIVLLSFWVIGLLSSLASAQQTLSRDGIDYELFDDGTATVTRIHYTRLYNNGEIEVPSVIEDYYQVTAFGAGLPVFDVDWFGLGGVDDEEWYKDDYFLETNTSKLKSMTLPETLTKIGKFAFAGCNSLTSIYIPGEVNFVDSCAFVGCNKLEQVHTADIRKWKEINFAGGVFGCTSNPLYYAHQLYENGEKITELSLNFVWYNNIGDYAFSGWDGSKVDLNNGVVQIGKGAFENCKNLESVSIYSWQADSIGESCFYDCERLKRVELPQVVKRIGRYAFQGCSSLGSIELPSSVEMIEEGAFWLCKSLANVNIPPKVTRIEPMTFGYCGIKSLSIPDGVKQIGPCAFYKCDSLLSVKIPGSVSMIERGALNSCSSLQSVIIEDSDTELDYSDEILGLNFSGPLLLENCPVERIYIGRNITAAFQPSLCNLPKLRTIVFGDSVTEILPEMFCQDSAIEEITFGSKVKTIGENAFAESRSINTVCCNSAIPADTPLSAFSTDAYRKATLIVPDGSRTAYESHPTWSNFMTIRELNGSTAVEDLRRGEEITVRTEPNAIVVSGAENVRIINATGSEVYRGASGIFRLHAGIYVVIADGERYKVRV